MALIAVISMENGWVPFAAAVTYYRSKLMANIGPIPVPASLERFAPYAKFAVSVAALIATVLTVVLASPPGWAFMVIAAANALGVYVVRNSNVKAIMLDGVTAVRDGEAALADGKAGNVTGARSEVTQAFRAVQDGVTEAEAVVKDIRSSSGV